MAHLQYINRATTKVVYDPSFGKPDGPPTYWFAHSLRIAYMTNLVSRGPVAHFQYITLAHSTLAYITIHYIGIHYCTLHWYAPEDVVATSIVASGLHLAVVSYDFEEPYKTNGFE